MSVVDTTTGEIVDEVIPPLTHDEARQLTDDINVTTLDAAVMVAAAWKGQAWKALGYKNWAHYADEELPLLGSNQANRQVLLIGLRNVGMSTRAIGAVTGLHPTTVGRHISGAANAAPDDETPTRNGTPEITGTDGKTYKATIRETRSETVECEQPDDSTAESPMLNTADHPSAGPKTEAGQALIEEAFDVDQTALAMSKDFGRALDVFRRWTPGAVHNLNDPDITQTVKNLATTILPWFDQFNNPPQTEECVVIEGAFQ